MRERVLFLVACAALWGGPARVAFAQPAGGDQQRLFEQMVQQPANYELTLKFVGVATANGDYEAAIGALERLLFYNPDLPQVKYQLGALYFRLGSYDMANRYFHEALASRNLDSATKGRIETYLSSSEKQLQQNRLSGLVQGGLRYQSNANYGPSGDMVRLGGLDLALLPQSTHQPDGSTYTIVGLSDDYDLNEQRGDVLETRLAAYDSHQFRFDDLNVDLFDLSIGPRMPIGSPSLNGATIKPYVVGGSDWVGGARYLSSAGAGLEAGIPLGPRWTVQPLVEWRYADYATNVGTPTASFATGNAYSGGFISTVKLSDDLAFESRTYYRRGTASFDFQSYYQWAQSAALTISFAPLVKSSPYQWSLAPYARYIRTAFDAANPYIDPNVAQLDNEWTGGVVLTAPLDGTFGLSATVQYDYTASTLPNYELRDFSVMAGPTARF